jgi:hypothetical protein
LEFIPVFVKLTPLLLSVVSFYVAVKLSFQYKDLIYTQQIKTFFETCKWFYNELVNNYVALPVLKAGRYVFDQYEKRVLEQHGPLFIVSSVNKILY